jgi:FkbM family methyltransferase
VIGKILRLPLKLIPSEAEVRILFGKLKGKKWIVDAGSHNYWLGGFEYHKQKIFERMVKENSVVYDIGAHVGFYTLLASVLVGKNGKVYAFEPNPRNLNYLKKHLSINKVTNVEVVECAVSDKDGQCSFDIDKRHDLGHISETGSFIVKTHSLDSLVFSNQILPPDFIKIDVEGAEFQVLNGARRILKEFAPVLIMDIHSEEIGKKCIELLTSFDYSFYPIEKKSLKGATELLAIYQKGKIATFPNP